MIAGNSQTAQVGTAVPIAPAVSVRDAANNVVPGVQVTFAVTGGNGAVTGGTPPTDGAGEATVTEWTLGTTAGQNRLTATAGSASVDFTANGTPGPPADVNYSIVTIGQNTLEVGSTLDAILWARDSFGNDITTGGQTVVFYTEGGTGSVAWSPTDDQGNGSYKATITAVAPGTPIMIRATIDGVVIATTPPTLTVWQP